MADVFISYARTNEREAREIEVALESHGFDVWRDTQLIAHQSFRKTIEEELNAARAVLVLWSPDAAQSDWVCSEATRAHALRKLVQCQVGDCQVPMPFDQVQCADLTRWTGDPGELGWQQVVAGVTSLVGNGAVLALEAHRPERQPKPSIAVLPFTNLSAESDQEHFVDGMLEEIVTALSRFRTIFVIGSGSSLSLKGLPLDSREAGRRLGVAYLLEGSVRRSGSRIRIDVRLIDAASGAQLWSERFDDLLTDIFALQDEVAHKVAARIEPSLQVAEINKRARRPTDSLTSYDLYLRAMSLHRTYTEAAIAEAMALTDRAIEIDPEFGLALALGAVCRNMSALYGSAQDPEANRRSGIELAHRALAVANDDAEVVAHAASVIAGLERDNEAALNLSDRAIALNPGSPIVWFMSALIRVRLGDNERAIDHVERAMRLDPLGPEIPNQIGCMAWARFQQRNFAEAIRLSKEFARLKAHPRAHAFLAASYGHLGNLEAAKDALARYEMLATRSIEDFASYFIINDDGHQLFMQGISLAREGENS